MGRKRTRPIPLTTIGLVGQLADVPEQRPELHLAAGNRDHQSGPEQGKGADAQRRWDLDQQHILCPPVAQV